MKTNFNSFNEDNIYLDFDNRIDDYLKKNKGIKWYKDSDLLIKDDLYKAHSNLISWRKIDDEEYKTMYYRLLDLWSMPKSNKETIIELNIIIKKFKKLNITEIDSVIEALELILDKFLTEIE